MAYPMGIFWSALRHSYHQQLRSLFSSVFSPHQQHQNVLIQNQSHSNNSKTSAHRASPPPPLQHSPPPCIVRPSELHIQRNIKNIHNTTPASPFLFKTSSQPSPSSLSDFTFVSPSYHHHHHHHPFHTPTSHSQLEYHQPTFKQPVIQPSLHQLEQQSQHPSINNNTTPTSTTSPNTMNVTDFKAFTPSWSFAKPSSFQLHQVLGHGTFGNVNLATDDFGRHVALKIIDKHTQLNERLARKVLRREIRNHSQLNHCNNIIRLHGLFDTKTHVILVLEYAQYGDLFNKITSHVPYDEIQCACIVHDILKALVYSHSLNIVHADIKPENVLIHHDGTARLADFGCSIQLLQNYTWTGGVSFQGEHGDDKDIGTVEFRAPEIWSGHDCDVMVDMWALGVMTYEILYQQLPFKKEFNYLVWRAVDFPDEPYITDEGRDFVNKLLVKTPKKRMTSEQALNHPWITKFGR